MVFFDLHFFGEYIRVVTNVNDKPTNQAQEKQNRTQTALGTTITGSVSSGVREGVGEVFDLYAKRTLKDIEENGYYVRVPAGKEFYVYVLQSVDPQKASLAGLKLRPPPAAPESDAAQPSLPNPTKG